MSESDASTVLSPAGGEAKFQRSSVFSYRSCCSLVIIIPGSLGGGAPSVLCESMDPGWCLDLDVCISSPGLNLHSCLLLGPGLWSRRQLGISLLSLFPPELVSAKVDRSQEIMELELGR